MHNLSITVASIALVGLGLLAELNLMCVLVRDWREGTLEHRARRFRAVPSTGRRHIAPSPRPKRPRRDIAGGLTVALGLASVSLGQDASK